MHDPPERDPVPTTGSRRRSPRRSVATLVALALPALVLVACSGDDDPGTGDTAAGAGIEEGAPWSGPAPTEEQMDPEGTAAIDQAAKEALVRSAGEVPGMWIGVWDSLAGRHLGAYGSAVVGGAVAEPGQIGRIGSVTNSFTAAAVLQQVDNGSLSLDDTVGDLLPELAERHPSTAATTVEDLLAMTSGIPDFVTSDWFLPMLAEEPTEVWDPAEIVDTTLEREQPTDPGTGDWSSTNYLILGEMLQQVLGDGDTATILTELAGEEGLERTAMPQPDDASMPAPFSNGYVNDPGSSGLADLGATVPPGTDVTDWSPSWAGAAGAMYADLEDLGTWAASGLGTDLLSRSLGGRRISQTTSLPEVGEYGLGIQVFGTGWVGHTGRFIGWESVVAYNTDTGDVFVGIANEGGARGALLAVAAEVFPELAEGMA